MQLQIVQNNLWKNERNGTFNLIKQIYLIITELRPEY